MKDIIQIEPFKVSLIQILVLCFVAGIGYGGYQSLSQGYDKILTKTSELTDSIKTFNDTMLVIQNEQKHRITEIDQLKRDAKNLKTEIVNNEKKLENHSVRITVLERG